MANIFQEVRRLDKKQEEAYKPLDEHIVVVAGPGSGKTHVLSLKVARLIHEVVEFPHGIACLTFTRSMAAELESRIFSILGDSSESFLVVDTVHAFCLRHVIRPFADLYELDIPNPIRIAPREILDQCFEDAWEGVFGYKYDGQNRTLSRLRGDWRKYRKSNSDISFTKWRNPKYAMLYESYRLNLFGEGYVDFDFLIEYALKLILDQELVRLSIYAKFPYLVIDEYQDLGYSLHRIVSKLIDTTPLKIFAIGDPNQAIYDFNGTDPKYLYELMERSEVQPVISLNKNYRSAKGIANVANIICPSHTDIECVNNDCNGYCNIYEYDEAGGKLEKNNIILNILSQYHEGGISFNDIAILSRYRERGIYQIGDFLESMDVPFQLDKNRYYDRSMFLIRWLEKMAYWCLWGWSEDNQSNIRYSELWAGLNRLLEKDKNFDREFLTSLLWELKGVDLLLRDWLSIICEELQVERRLTTYREEYPDEIEEFYKLLHLAEKGNELGEMMLSKFAVSSKGVNLTTLHGCKGMQYDYVIIYDIESIRDNDNDRRLLYVGMTRAKCEVNLLCGVRTGQYLNQSLSRYVSEITAQMDFEDCIRIYRS